MTYHISGDIIGATLDGILETILGAFNAARVVKRSREEARLTSDDFDLDIYTFRPSGTGTADFLIGGKVTADKEAAIGLVKELSRALTDAGIEQYLNVYDECTSHSEVMFAIKSPKF